MDDQLIGATIGGRHTSEWGLRLTNLQISSPKPKTVVIDIPYGDGALDLTEYLTDDVVYNTRELTMTFCFVGSYELWEERLSDLCNFLHGQKSELILDTDANFQYFGRFEITSQKQDDVLADIVITGTVDPYKYECTSSLEDWMWDSFSFETGIIREYKDLQVDNELTVTIPGRRKKVIPTIICSSDMQVEYNEISYPLKRGNNRIPELAMGTGEHVLKFTGTGTLSIEYRGGSL